MAERERPAGAPVDGQAPVPRPGGAAVRMVGAWLLAVAAAVGALRAADALPRLVLGVPRGVVRAEGIADLERRAGRRMPVPAYFPDTIEWPPAESRLHSGGSAAIWCHLRASGGIALIVATAPRGARGIDDSVLPASLELQREPASFGARAAVVSRVRDADGAVWQQVEWPGRGQIILVRYRGTLDELMKIAGSVHE